MKNNIPVDSVQVRDFSTAPLESDASPLAILLEAKKFKLLALRYGLSHKCSVI